MPPARAACDERWLIISIKLSTPIILTFDIVYLGANIEIVHGICAHERHLTVGVGVNAPGDDELPRRVDDPRSAGDFEVEADLLDGPILDVDIRSLPAILVNDLAPLDQNPVMRTY